MKIYTVATESVGYFKTLMESCQRHSVDLQVLGWNEKWKGFLWKWKLIYKEITGATIGDEEFICVVDAYDLVFLQNPAFIEDTIKKKNLQDKLIVGAQKQGSMRHSYLFGLCQGVGINAGNILGKKRVIMKFIENMCMDGVKCRDGDDDQVLLTQYCKTFPAEVYIDVDYDIFLIYYPKYLRDGVYTLDYDKDTGSIVVDTGKQPFCIHAPGNSMMDDVLEKLGYTGIEGNQKRSIIAYGYSYVTHWVMMPHVWIPLFVIITVSVIVLLYFCA